jgi:hypothetical protein
MTADDEQIRALGERLLGSLGGDAPPRGAKEATLAALGLSSALAGPAVASGLTFAGIAKAGVTGALVGVLAMTGYTGVRHLTSSSRPEPARSASAPSGALLVRPTPAVPLPEPAALAKKQLEPRASAPLPPRATARAAEELAPEPSPVLLPPSSLQAETAALDRVRAALNSGQASMGLAELGRYEAAFPRGMLRPESVVLKVEALVMAGDRARARELALAFIAAHPESPHTGRLRSLVGL